MPVENLDEVTVTAQDMREPLMFNHYLTMNDKTQVNNLPHREYNTSLKANGERGAREHALWDKEHPNLSAWRDAATTIPFGIAAIPLVGGGGSSLLGTAAGQAARSYATKVLANPLVEMANNAIGLGFAGKGAYDVSQGKFTPETAMDLVGGVGLLAKGSNMFDRMLTVRKPTTRGLLNGASNKSIDLDEVLDPEGWDKAGNYWGYDNAERRLGDVIIDTPEPITRAEDFGKPTASNSTEDIPFSYKQDPLEMHIQRVKANGKYDPSEVKVLNLSKDSKENTEFINNLAKEIGTTPKQTSDYLQKTLNDELGHAAFVKGSKYVIHDGKLPNSHLNIALSHELDHALHIPDEPLPNGVFYPWFYTKYKASNYFGIDNSTEAAARGSQLHDYFGHTGTEPLTIEQLKYARDHYIEDTGMNNNNMWDFLHGIKDYDALAKWLTKYATGIIPVGIINKNNNQSNK